MSYSSANVSGSIIQMTSHNTRRSANRDEVLTVLENSPKGRLVYQTGWDASPNSIWQFVKTVHAKSEEKENDVLEGAYRASEFSKRRSLTLLESNGTSNSNTGTSYRNRSLNENQLSQGSALTPSPNSNTSYDLNSSSSPSLSNTRNHISSAKQLTYVKKSPPEISSMTRKASNTKMHTRPKRLYNKSLGIREEDKDYTGVEDEDLEPSRCVYFKVKNMLIREQNAKIAKEIKKIQMELLAFQTKLEQNVDEIALRTAQMNLQKEPERERLEKQTEESMKIKRNKEVFRRQMFVEKDDPRFEDHGREELLKLSEAQKQAEQDIQKKFEEQKQNELLIKEKEAAESREKDRQAKLEAERVAAEIAKLEEEKLAKAKLQQLPKGYDVPSELSNYILRDDLQQYTKLLTKEEEYGSLTSHISSSNPAIKDYYFSALKVVNTPLNSLANLSESHSQQKIIHFIDLLSGKPVLANDTMKVPFQSTVIPSGDLFIMKLLAYRFIKKSETEITKQKSCMDSLALVGIHLCKRFPEWATLVHANFYKMCPFLVPFNFPRNEDTLQQYAQRMGHELSGGESAMLQTLLDRITGYCTLFALMVKQFETHKIDDVGKSTSFFSIGDVWRILSTMMRLEPQLDVTATTIHVLLEVLGDRLQAIYGKQFSKLIHHLTNAYIPKLRNVTPPGKAGALTRLQLFIQQKLYR